MRQVKTNVTDLKYLNMHHCSKKYVLDLRGSRIKEWFKLYFMPENKRKVVTIKKKQLKYIYL